MNKGKLTAFFRSIGLMHFLDKLKYYFYYLKNRKVNSAFKKQYPDVVLPPDYMMFESFQLNYSKYYFGGKESAEHIRNEIAEFTDLHSKNILDWGCGPARIIRHLPEVIGNGCKFYGSDYNAQTIEWCKQHIKGIDFRRNLLAPPLDYEGDFFDALYAISIFTHLSEKHHFTWYEELIRVSKQGAMLLLTTHGEAFKVNMTEKEKKQFNEGKLVVRSNAVEGHRVYVAFHPIAFIKPLFEKHCEVLKHTPGKKENWGISQDTWILRKK